MASPLVISISASFLETRGAEGGQQAQREGEGEEGQVSVPLAQSAKEGEGGEKRKEETFTVKVG